VNKVVAGRTQAESDKANFLHIKERTAIYEKKNRERITARQKKHRLDNPEHCRAIQAKSRKKNAKQRQEYNTRYEMANRDKIEARRSTPVACQLCGTITRHDAMTKHMRRCFKNSCDSMNLIEI
jgi:hypothetical protein